MLIKVSDIQLNEHIATTYRKISLYRVPCVLVKRITGNKQDTLYIDNKYLKYLHNEPGMEFLKTFVENWICENIKDIELRQFILEEMKTMDRYELMRFYIFKKLL